MNYAEVIGWGKCAPPAVLTNADLATFMDTSDEWIYTRTGIRQRHISHVPALKWQELPANARLLALA